MGAYCLKVGAPLDSLHLISNNIVWNSTNYDDTLKCTWFYLGKNVTAILSCALMFLLLFSVIVVQHIKPLKNNWF